ncbi:hypothetical protein JK358_00485 [Nocardia sp. 2]|uniref:Uncharacterized protein n=1 Tax=Nocardia acididurans TaxID=2802282 RepID=A0ABS1LY69_9NOCA|nr:hypothetical protein [Nocardia acididurans]MBL1072865.1 hypothetical protein [Nocardia acididurans]
MNLSNLAKRRKLYLSDVPGEDIPVLPKPEASTYEWAAANPGRWEYFVDPTVDESKLGKANVIGGWRAGEAGDIAETWLNPEFVPTRAYSKRDITTGFELTIWRLDYGFANLGQFMDSFLRSELIIVLPEDDPTGARGWPLKHVPTSTAVVVYTSAGHLPPDTNPWLRRTVSGREVLEQVCAQGWDLLINLYTRDGYELRSEHLADWWEQYREAQRTGDAPPDKA